VKTGPLFVSRRQKTLEPIPLRPYIRGDAMGVASINAMSEDQSSNGSGKKTWVEKIGAAFSHQPRNRDELLEILQGAREQGILDYSTTMHSP